MIVERSGERKINNARIMTGMPLMISLNMMIFRREKWSANVPAIGPRTTAGSIEIIMSKPISEADPVWCLIQNIIAMANACEPS